MEALRRSAVVREDGRVTVRGLPYRKGDRVDVILLRQEQATERHGMTALDLAEPGLVGIWADRDDITDSSEFARELREKGQSRSDRQ